MTWEARKNLVVNLLLVVFRRLSVLAEALRTVSLRWSSGCGLERKKMASNFNWFSRATRQQEYDRRVATHLHLLTPHLISAVTPSIVSHTRRSIIRDHGRGYEDLWNRYFKSDCMYSESMFRRRFRMRRTLFFRIQTDIEQTDPYFIQRRNAAGS